MNRPILIFDFDGTIADTHHYICEISNRLSHEFRFNKIDMEELDSLKDKTTQEIIKHLRVPLLKIPAIVAKAKKEFQTGIASLKPSEGIEEILFQLKDLKIKMGILSSNSRENVKAFLAHHNLDVFDFIHTTPKVWSKNISLKKIIEKNGFDLNQTLYIGDEVRDIAAARKSGVKIAAVGWGYNSVKALKEFEPDYFVETPTELFEICRGHISTSTFP